MAHFDKNFVSFFKGLSANNSTAWFNENRKTYQTTVTEPFKAFVDEKDQKDTKASA